MKVFAFYLPQYHEIPENNQWWGKGFTEWHNVRNSKPLFASHIQPMLPFQNFYYDLSDKKTLEWQIEYAKNLCNINGFAIYHYYFNGKHLLEKPAELLLKNKDLKIEFFFTWANESWTRSWDGKHKDILIEQEYGDTKIWENHINYLINFFHDDRYLKIDDMPVLAIYKPIEIEELNKMKECWEEVLHINNFKGIYLININRGIQYDKRKLFNADLIFEPTYTQYSRKIFLWANRIKRLVSKVMIKTIKPNIIDVKRVYEKSISNEIANKNTYLGAFVNWDNSPRRGAKGTIFINFTVNDFSSYLEKMLLKAKKYNNQLFFINAWNEWAEGTFIEPSTIYGHQIGMSIKECLDERKN